MTRPPDRFPGREPVWNTLADWIEQGEGRGLSEGEEARLYYLFSEFLPEHRNEYPSGISRLEVWYDRQTAFMNLQQFIAENYEGDYDLSDWIDDEAWWRENYEQIT